MIATENLFPIPMYTLLPEIFSIPSKNGNAMPKKAKIILKIIVTIKSAPEPNNIIKNI